MEQPQIFNFRCWIVETDPEQLKATFGEMLHQAGYGIVNFCDHYFSPQGYTCLWLLSESHLAVHTFPEAQKTYVELSGCSSEMNEVFRKLFDAQFKALKVVENEV